MHKDSLIIREYLILNKKKKANDIAKYLIKINAGPPVIGNNKPVKTMILMDATGSMSALLNKAKNSVGLMYERAGKILENNGLESSLNLLQYVCYRNYSSPVNLLLESSPWESKPTNLRAFMDKVSVSGGISEEAVEVGLQHALYEADNFGEVPLHQVFLIGDAPPNPRNTVD